MQRLEQRSPDAILLLFLIAQTVDITMPVFALLALVAYSVSLALIVPGLLQKNGGWRRMAIISAVIALVCHAIALEARILPDGDSGQNLSLLNVGSLVSLMICTVMTSRILLQHNLQVVIGPQVQSVKDEMADLMHTVQA